MKRVVVLVAVLAAAGIALVGAGAGAAGVNAPTACSSKKFTALCKGTATIHIGRKWTRYSGVACYIDKTAHYPAEIWKQDAFLIKMAVGAHSLTSKAAVLLAGNVSPALIKVKLRASRRSGTFSGHGANGKTVVSGSFTCK
jgi:hypothetical protein